jgi:hypothetical protein
MDRALYDSWVYCVGYVNKSLPMLLAGNRCFGMRLGEILSRYSFFATIFCVSGNLLFYSQKQPCTHTSSYLNYKTISMGEAESKITAISDSF